MNFKQWLSETTSTSSIANFVRPIGSGELVKRQWPFATEEEPKKKRKKKRKKKGKKKKNMFS